MEPYTNYTTNADDYYEEKIAEEQDELNDQLIELSFKVFNLFLKFISPHLGLLNIKKMLPIFCQK